MTVHSHVFNTAHNLRNAQLDAKGKLETLLIVMHVKVAYMSNKSTLMGHWRSLLLTLVSITDVSQTNTTKH